MAESNKKTYVMIATPTLGNIRIETAQSIFNIAKKQYDDYRVDWPILSPSVIQPLDAARNRYVKKFVELSNDPDDRLLFIDDDIVPPVDVIERLAGHDKDVISARCYIMKQKDGVYFPCPTSLKYNDEKKFIMHYGSGLERINATGGGCIMIKRKVFESMDRSYEYNYYPNGELSLVADFIFCQKAEENGFEIWYDYDVVCDHIKPISLKRVNDLLVKNNG
jgi:hypothetical protein